MRFKFAFFCSFVVAFVQIKWDGRGLDSRVKEYAGYDCCCDVLNTELSMYVGVLGEGCREEAKESEQEGLEVHVLDVVLLLVSMVMVCFVFEIDVKMREESFLGVYLYGLRLPRFAMILFAVATFACANPRTERPAFCGLVLIRWCMVGDFGCDRFVLLLRGYGSCLNCWNKKCGDMRPKQ